MPKESRSNWRIAAWGAVLFTLALCAVVWSVRLVAGERLPKLTAERFNEERAAWQHDPADNYRITIVVRGRQPATYTVDVRSGIPLAAFRNGQPLQDRRTFRTWTVDGMFGTMEYDVDRNANAEGAEPLDLGARFDERWHYPASYRRIEWGTTFEVEWEVTEFVLRDADDDVWQAGEIEAVGASR